MDSRQTSEDVTQAGVVGLRCSAQMLRPAPVSGAKARKRPVSSDHHEKPAQYPVDDSAPYEGRIAPRTKQHCRLDSVCVVVLEAFAPHKWNTSQRPERCSRRISFASLLTATCFECSPNDYHSAPLWVTSSLSIKCAMYPYSSLLTHSGVWLLPQST